MGKGSKNANDPQWGSGKQNFFVVQMSATKKFCETSFLCWTRFWVGLFVLSPFTTLSFASSVKPFSCALAESITTNDGSFVQGPRNLVQKLADTGALFWSFPPAEGAHHAGSCAFCA